MDGSWIIPGPFRPDFREAAGAARRSFRATDDSNLKLHIARNAPQGGCPFAVSPWNPVPRRAPPGWRPRPARATCRGPGATLSILKSVQSSAKHFATRGLHGMW